jgi:hypothetical protein
VYPNCASHNADMRDLLPGWAHLSCSHRERQREGKPAFIPHHRKQGRRPVACRSAILWLVRPVPVAGKGSTSTTMPARIHRWPNRDRRWAVACYPREQAAWRRPCRRWRLSSDWTAGRKSARASRTPYATRDGHGSSQDGLRQLGHGGRKLAFGVNGGGRRLQGSGGLFPWRARAGEVGR